jgi:hypothetical protein
MPGPEFANGHDAGLAQVVVHTVHLLLLEVLSQLFGQYLVVEMGRM